MLDPADGRFAELNGMDLLTQLADHLAAAVSLLLAARAAGRAASTHPEADPWLRLERTLSRTGTRDSRAVSRFVHALDDLIATCYGGAAGRSGDASR